MRTGFFIISASFIMLLTCAPSHGQSNITPFKDPVVSIIQPAGFSVGVDYRADRRTMESELMREKIDLDTVSANAGFTVLPFLHVAAEAGWVKAEAGETGNFERDGAVMVGFQVNASLWDYVISESPTIGKKQSVGFGIDFEGRFWEDDTDDVTLDWSETTILPYFHYTVDSRGEFTVTPPDPNGMSSFIGLAFSSVDGDLDGEDLSAEEELGIAAGINLRWARDWVAKFQGRFYSGDRTLQLGVSYYF